LGLKKELGFKKEKNRKTQEGEKKETCWELNARIVFKGLVG